jgi:hypothetical protein
MTPTPKLRFVERDSYSHNGEHFREPHKIRILQQWFAPFHRFSDGFGYVEQELKGGEWRDVPLEKEA